MKFSHEAARDIIREKIVIGADTPGPIYGDLRRSESAENKPVIVICHSFMAFKDWGFFPHIGEEFARAGFCTLAFNYSYDGVGAEGGKITDLARFEANTFSRELADTARVIEAIRSGEIGRGFIDRATIILLGHSRGGGVAIVTASRDSRIKALITLASISTFDRWTPHQKERWRAAGYLALARDTTANPLRLGLGLLNDLEAHADNLSIAKAAGTIHVPWLILHSAADVTVKVNEAHALYNSSNKSTTELVIVEKAGHLFNAASPTEDGYATIDKTVTAIISWLHNIL
jgi:pimeloyl-ACP methyl ester carboxylesterase